MLPAERDRDKIQLIAPARSLQIVGPPLPRRYPPQHDRTWKKLGRSKKASSRVVVVVVECPRAYHGVGFRFDTNDPPPVEKPPVESSTSALLAAVIDYCRIKAGVSADNPRRYGSENGIDSGGVSDRGQTATLVKSVSRKRRAKSTSVNQR